MPGATNLWELDVLDLIFTNVAAPNMGDVGGLLPSAVPGTMAIALHTGNTISETSTVQTQVEAAYTGYVRQQVVRSAAQWTVAGDGVVDNDNAINFVISTSGPETETDVSLGGFAGVMQMFASLDADLVVNSGVTPEFAPQALAISLD
jgi:hypothetical protein